MGTTQVCRRGYAEAVRALSTIAVCVAIVLSSCGGSTTTTSRQATTTDQPTTVTSQASVTTSPTIVATTRSHIPAWITVKYRPDPVDVAAPWFVGLGRSDSSLVDAAFYDAGNRYAIIVLNGTPYHYCGIPPGLWSSFRSAESLGRYFNAQIKGDFDCRTGFIPEY